MNKKLIIITGIIFLLLIALAGLAMAAGFIVISKEKEPDKTPEFYNSLGDYLVEQNDFAGAIAAYQTSLTLEEDAVTRNNAAILYHRLGRYSEAIHHMKILVNNHPDNPEYHYDLAVNLVDRFRHTDDKQADDLFSALEHYKKAEQISPGFANADNNIQVLERIIEESSVN